MHWEMQHAITYCTVLETYSAYQKKGNPYSKAYCSNVNPF